MNKGIGLTSRAGKRSIKSRSQSEAISQDCDERQNLLNDADGDSDEGDPDNVWNNNYRVWKAKDEDHFGGDELLIPMVGRPPSKPPNDQCVEAEIQPDETLASVALKYNIPVAELKRVNRLLNEKDFYARKTIRIPVKPASLLTEILPASDQTILESNHNANHVSFSYSESPKAGSPSPSTTPEVDRAQRLLKQIDNNVRNISRKQENREQEFSSIETDSIHVLAPGQTEETSIFDRLNTNKKWIGFYLVVLVLAGFCIYLIENYERQILTHSSHEVFSSAS